MSPGRALTPIRDHWLVPGAKGCALSSSCLSSPWPQFPHLLSAPGQVSALAMVWVLRGAGKPLGEHPCSGRAEEKGLSLSLYLRTGGPGPVPCRTEGGDARGVPAPSPQERAARWSWGWAETPGLGRAGGRKGPWWVRAGSLGRSPRWPRGQERGAFSWKGIKSCLITFVFLQPLLPGLCNAPSPRPSPLPGVTARRCPRHPRPPLAARGAL